MPAIGIDKVTLVSIFVESTLYGIMLVLSCVAIYVLLRRGKRAHSNKPMIVVSVAMIIFATIHIGADLKRLLVAFLSDDKAQTTKSLSEVNTVNYGTLIGDGFVLYRLYVVWQGDKRVCVPILVCFIASIGVGVGTLRGFARASPSSPVFITQLHNWIVSFFSLTLFTNFSCTALIAGRIWWVHRKTVAMVRGRSIMPAAMVVIESGAIYSACLIILIALYLSGSFAQYILLDAGIVFSLIIVRVGLGLTSEITGRGGTLFTNTMQNSGPSGGASPSYRMKPVAVNIVRVTRDDGTHSVDESPGALRHKHDSDDGGQDDSSAHDIEGAAV
ncbi:hypothetical protein FA95DRAFT_1559059 [Auriscalpium vulgare]|uniref:Uncharacterized protein n=1 Tax=Auriscalpium vulgare TaxID=40419 RepID=A0ACB8RUL6_9AGAM|nr:hypothetical protein FA95DRAFT_1559059 [Auriscalpium vulgare]